MNFHATNIRIVTPFNIFAKCFIVACMSSAEKFKKFIPRGGLIFFAILAIAVFGVWLVFIVKTAGTDPDRDRLTQTPLPMPMPQIIEVPENAGVKLQEAPPDPFRAAAARSTTGTDQKLSEATDCVALVSAFNLAVRQCAGNPEPKTCSSIAVRKKGFDPELYDFCKLYKPASTISPFG
jgi:hypothetical protein